MSPRRAVFLIGVLAALAAAGGLRAGDDGPVVERGAFRLHLHKRPTGRETYEIRRDGDLLVLEAHYENTDRGTKEPLTAMMRLRDGRVPGRFEVKGRTSRFTEIDSEVRVEGRTATVREGKTTTTRPVPDRFFFAGGFAPVSVQMMLIRDWERAHGAGPLETLPSGSVTIEKRGATPSRLRGSGSSSIATASAGSSGAARSSGSIPSGGSSPRSPSTLSSTASRRSARASSRPCRPSWPGPPRTAWRCWPGSQTALARSGRVRRRSSARP